MSVGPRIVFTRFVTVDSPKLQPWSDHFRRVVGRAPSLVTSGAGTDDDGAVVWQLVSANNRMLARSASIYGSFDDALTGAREAVAAGSELNVALTSDERHGVYGWYVSHAGDVAMTCSRWYLTERDRRHSIELALSSVLIALLNPGARLMDPALMGGARERVEH